MEMESENSDGFLDCARHANFFCPQGVSKHVRTNFNLWSSICPFLAARCSESRFKRELHRSGNSQRAMNPKINEVVGMSLPHM